MSCLMRNDWDAYLNDEVINSWLAMLQEKHDMKTLAYNDEVARNAPSKSATTTSHIDEGSSAEPPILYWYYQGKEGWEKPPIIYAKCGSGGLGALTPSGMRRTSHIFSTHFMGKLLQKAPDPKDARAEITKGYLYHDDTVRR